MSVLHKLENLGKRVFAGNPAVKRVCKRAYQLGMYAISPKLKVDGDVRRITPLDGNQYFFGYYDKSPWDASGRYLLCLRAKKCDAPAPDAPAELLLIDTANGNAMEVLGQTHAWNVQQGCMLQWLGPDYEKYILFNDYRGGRYCAVVYDVAARCEVRTLPRAVYTVSADGRTALSADFSRLHRLRPGYGYANLPDETGNAPLPDAPCVWRMSLATGSVTPILRYTDLAGFEPRPEMAGAEHKINHLMLNPSGTRFMALHRWFVGQKKYTRLITCDIDGQALFNLSDDDFVSHCNWLDDDTVLSYCRKKGQGDGYYVMTDRTGDYRRVWQSLDTDGHMSLSPDGTRVATDTYPNQRRVSTVYVLQGDEIRTAARVFSPFRYDGDLRCDLHPRWNRDGTLIAFDSTHEGNRGLYVVPAGASSGVPALPAPNEITSASSNVSLRVLQIMTIPMVYDGPNQFTLRFARSMDRSDMRVDYLTYRLGDERIRREVRELSGDLYVAPNRLKKPIRYIRYVAALIRKNDYTVVHAHGNSCTLAIDLLGAKLGGAKVRIAHSHNSRCKFIWLHRVLRPLFNHLYTHAMACGEEAGRWLFGKRPFTIVRNAIDTRRFAYAPDTRDRLRAEFGIGDEIVLGSVAHFTPHKNHVFMIDMFAGLLKRSPDYVLVLVGGGGLKADALRQAEALGIANKIIFTDVRTDVPQLLQMMDVMLLPSLFEGFPTVALEWQCAGLPSLLADTITKDCAFTKLVRFLPLDAEQWIHAILETARSSCREADSQNSIQAISQAGYDLSAEAQKLQATYVAAARK